jgi:hypothetical protein
MPSATHHLSISAARAGALFASPLQRCDEPSARQVRQAIATAIGVQGVRGCAARVAQAYGEHPETALTRMRWALTAVASALGGSRAEPAHATPRVSPPRGVHARRSPATAPCSPNQRNGRAATSPCHPGGEPCQGRHGRYRGRR